MLANRQRFEIVKYFLRGDSMAEVANKYKVSLSEVEAAIRQEFNYATNKRR